ncbi:hypothetical protein F5I97DRAFT_1923814 [Phlebopus sp. FC_14]|nr:hypothetical protein F5I97DRAFT_1923814 [Phlebopus sp. FC_14]
MQSPVATSSSTLLVATVSRRDEDVGQEQTDSVKSKASLAYILTAASPVLTEIQTNLIAHSPPTGPVLTEIQSDPISNLPPTGPVLPEIQNNPIIDSPPTGSVLTEIQNNPIADSAHAYLASELDNKLTTEWQSWSTELRNLPPKFRRAAHALSRVDNERRLHEHIEIGAAAGGHGNNKRAPKRTARLRREGTRSSLRLQSQRQKKSEEDAARENTYSTIQKVESIDWSEMTFSFTTNVEGTSQ